MQPIEIKKEYEQLRKKHNLPSYEELDNEFELLYFSPVIEVNYVLRFIRRRITDKLKGFVNFFHGIINPNPSNLISLQESKFIPQEEKEKISELINEIMVLDSKSILLDLEQSEKNDAEFIKEALKRWSKMKKTITNYVSKIKEGWESDIKEEEKSHYFG